MEKDYFISIYLDKRRAKASGKYPVKLRVFTKAPRKQMLYPTIFEFTLTEFKSIWETVKPRDEHKLIRKKIMTTENLDIEIAEKIKPFSFSEFEKKYLRNSGDGSNVIYQYEQIINKFKNNNSLSTASNYELSIKSLKDFILYEKGVKSKIIFFHEINSEWLQKYELYMITKLNRSRTTVSMYLRALRTVFNVAITNKEIDAEVYPFGKNKYQPPTVRSVKKALNNEQLKKLFESIPNTEEQEKAKDFWFFSYACNGMNIKDIALLKCEDLQDEKIIFYRAKTINTSKSDLKPIIVYLNEFSKAIIEKYGNKSLSKGQFLFPIISNADNESIKHNKIKNFTKFINQNLKKLAVKEGLTKEISTYWARHSFATNSIRNGASMEFIMEALNHNNMKTTIGYFAGFEDSDKRDFMQKLMDF